MFKIEGWIIVKNVLDSSQFLLGNCLIIDYPGNQFSLFFHFFPLQTPTYAYSIANGRDFHARLSLFVCTGLLVQGPAWRTLWLTANQSWTSIQRTFDNSKPFCSRWATVTQQLNRFRINTKESRFDGSSCQKHFTFRVPIKYFFFKPVKQFSRN